MIKPGEITVQLGGKERLVKFGLGSTKVVCMEHGIKLSEMAQRFNLDDLFTEEIYGGLVHALALEGKKPDFNRAQVFDWIDALPQTDLQLMFDVWLTTSQHGETRFEKFMKVIASMNPDDDAEKKKLTGQM
jgi:hypothetical protein